jgi:DNA-binding LytR/AlgR family response regulator
MIKAIALDDEPPALEIIETFCSKVDFIVLEKTFTKTGEAFKHVEKNNVDLLFLDINMPSISGIEFYNSIPKKAMVIFTTSYSEYAIEGYNLNAVDYLLKPYTFNRFLQAADKAREKYNFLHSVAATSKEQHIMLRADYGLVKVTLADILFIEGLDNYLKIHLQNQKPLVIRITMKSLLEKLPENDFVRVHRSYIIPINRIEAVRNKMITIAGEEIPIGTSYEENFLSLFKK